MGRKLAFSREVALEQAMENFWANGYAQTSMRDLAEKLGLHLGSVYNALGDKDRVFEQAFRLHLERDVYPRLNEIAAASAPLSAIESFLHDTAKDCASGKSSGCFIINSILNIADISEGVSAAVRECVAAVEKALSACVTRGQSMGEISTTRAPVQYAHFLLAMSKSLYVMQKIGMSAEAANDVCACTVDSLRAKAA